jgi:hypothetical protein
MLSLRGECHTKQVGHIFPVDVDWLQGTVIIPSKFEKKHIGECRRHDACYRTTPLGFVKQRIGLRGRSLDNIY